MSQYKALGLITFAQLTTAERDAITNIPANLIIDNITTNQVERYRNGAWQSIHTDDAYNGSFLEPMTFVVTSDGATITGTIDKNPTGDLTERFSDGFSTLTSGSTVTLTAGGDTAPKKNFIYVLQSNKGVLVASDSDWPATEHIKVAEVVVQTAALVQTNGILANRNWDDHAQETDGMGHHLDAWKRLRWEHAAYKSGSAVTWSGSGTAALDLAISAGQIYQMHLHIDAAFDTADPDNVYVVNHPTAYTITPDIETLVVDSGNVSLSNRYYNLVIWRSVSSGSEEEQVFINLPSGSYKKQSDAENDVSGYDNFAIPTDYRGYAYLVQRVTIKHSTAGGGTWTIHQETDLRGTVPSLAVGGGTLAGTTEFADSAFKLFDDGDPTKELAFQVSGIAASTTRTITVPDEDVSLVDDGTSDPLIDADSAADGSEGSLARKDHVHPKHHAKYTDGDLPAASTTVSGIAEIATTAEIDAATPSRMVTTDKLGDSIYSERILGFLISDPGGDALTTGDTKAMARIPSSMNGYELVEANACVTTVSSSGPVTIQVAKSSRTNATTRTASVNMLSTPITIDVSEFDSLDAAAEVIQTDGKEDVVTGDQIRIDIDAAGTGVKGLFVELIFRLK